MTLKDTRYIINNRRFPVTLSSFWRYPALIFPGFIVVVGLSICFSEGIKKPFVFIWPLIHGIGIYLVRSMFIHIQADRKFYSIYTTINNQQSVVECMKVLGWRIVKEDALTVIAETKMTAFSWGEVITVIINGDELLFNSRPSESPTSTNKDIRNFWNFFQEIELREKSTSVNKAFMK